MELEAFRDEYSPLENVPHNPLELDQPRSGSRRLRFPLLLLANAYSRGVLNSATDRQESLSRRCYRFDKLPSDVCGQRLHGFSNGRLMNPYTRLLFSSWAVLRCIVAVSVSLAACLLNGQQDTKTDRPLVSVVLQTPQDRQALTGEVQLEAEDGGVLLLEPSGRLSLVQPEQMRERRAEPGELAVWDQETMSKALLEEMPDGFRIHRTDHYIFCYNTSDAYAKWTAALFERLYRGFYNYWKSRGVELQEPRFPLVALVFEDQKSYLQYAEAELGEAARSMLGYYHMMSNRVASFDLTGIEGKIAPGQTVDRVELVQRILAQPQAERTVATIVHEAVHQLAYNSGLQVRLADNPLWVSEGLAVFFESPDTSHGSGWRSIGKINQHNLMIFKQYLADRPADSLTQLISDDSRFRQANTSAYAYAECWALTYFLLKTQTKQYIAYLEDLASQDPLGENDARARVELFQKYFGEIAKVERQFMKFMMAQP